MSSASAAGPLMHLYLADRWCEMEKISKEEKLDVLRGSVFPDIRYLLDIPREQTHLSNVSYGNILLMRHPFDKGRMHHCFVDEKRAKFICEYNILKLITPYSEELAGTLLKIVEDQIIFEQCNASLFQSAFKEKSAAEIATQVSNTQLNKFHVFLDFYISKGPVGIFKPIILMNEEFLGVSPKILKSWIDIVPELTQNKRIRKYVRDLVNDFDASYQTADRASS